jgi:hypothetical protein
MKPQSQWPLIEPKKGAAGALTSRQRFGTLGGRESQNSMGGGGFFFLLIFLDS